MQKIENFEKINEAGDFRKLPAGVYPLQIKKVVDNPSKNYLEVQFDICSGEYKDYYSSSSKKYGSSIRSYTDKALPFFKAFITAVEKTNSGYKWDWDESKLAGKYVMGVFGEEEYIHMNDDGSKEVRISCKVQEFRSKEAYVSGKIRVPELKKLSDEERASMTSSVVPETSTSIVDDDLPF